MSAVAGAATAPVAGATIPPVPSGTAAYLKADKPFPLPAIICIAIVGGVVAIIVIYKVYKCICARRQQYRSSCNEPPSPTSTNPLISPAGVTAPAYMTQASPFGHYHPSVYARMSSYYSGSTMAGMDTVKSGLADSPDFPMPPPSLSSRTLGGASSYRSSDSQSSGFHQQQQQSHHHYYHHQPRTESFSSVMNGNGLVPPSMESTGSTSSSGFTSPSDASSPSSTGPRALASDGSNRSSTPSDSIATPISAYSNPGTVHRPGIRGDSSMSTDRLRAQGSRSSMLYPNVPTSHTTQNSHQHHSHGNRRSIAHVSSYSSMSSTSQGSSNYGRSHSPKPRTPQRISGAPHLRHSRIEIVPPMPLAPPPGTVVATDKTTLAFSPLSGIGSGKALFGSNMHLAHAAAPDPALSGTTAAKRRSQQLPHQQHQRQYTSQTTHTQASSSNGSGDDVSSVGGGGWFNTPVGTSEDNLTGKAGATTSSNGSRNTLDGPPSSTEADAYHNEGLVHNDPLVKLATPVRHSTLQTGVEQSPLDKLKQDLQDRATQ